MNPAIFCTFLGCCILLAIADVSSGQSLYDLIGDQTERFELEEAGEELRAEDVADVATVSNPKGLVRNKRDCFNRKNEQSEGKSSKGLKGMFKGFKSKVGFNKSKPQPNVVEQVPTEQKAAPPVEVAPTLTSNDRPDLSLREDERYDNTLVQNTVRPPGDHHIYMDVVGDDNSTLGRIALQVDPSKFPNRVEHSAGGRPTHGPIVEDGKYRLENPNYAMEALSHRIGNINMYPKL